ncbi:hypothetical protein [Gemmatimonas aurantiaca]|uniref:tetratricopeptide repeat protein n=1 Tax=Gemmatimonas aurantiaca TaxID=173480 RepID=UPI00301D3B42
MSTRIKPFLPIALRSRRHLAPLAPGLLLLCATSPASAQPTGVRVAPAPASTASPEFVRQALLVAPFRPDSTPAGLANVSRDLSDVLRDRLGKRIDGRETQLLESYHLRNILLESGYPRNAILGDVELRLMARKVRADEVVFGRVMRQGNTYVVAGRMARLRNWEMQQPLPVVRGTTVAQVAERLADEVVKARAQLQGLRRCENALEKRDKAMAAREATRAIQAYPQAVIARDCLLSALFDGQTGADSILTVANDALHIDSTNTYAAVARANALEALSRRAEALAQWSRIYAAHDDSLSLATVVVEAQLRLQRPDDAMHNARALAERFGNNAELQRLVFRAQTALAQWHDAAVLGDSLELADSTFRADSNYATRFVEALRQSGDSLGALELVVRNVRRFPGDSRLYLQYLQLLGIENGVALQRGLERFPDVSTLNVMAASAARRSGNRTAAIRATQEAIRKDSSLTPQYLQLADAFFEQQQPDSAFVTLLLAPRHGDQAEILRGYVVARGVTLLRTASDSAPALQQTAVRMLVLADSIASREDTRSYLAAAALQASRAQLVTASRSRTCVDVRSSEETLQLSADAIARGLGEGANAAEISAAYEAMRVAVENAIRSLCKEP